MTRIDVETDALRPVAQRLTTTGAELPQAAAELGSVAEAGGAADDANVAGALALFAGAWQASITGLGTATTAFGTGLGSAADAYDMTDRCAIPRGGR
jgi:hypothetical protein